MVLIIGLVLLALALFIGWRLFKAAVRTLIALAVLIVAIVFFSTVGRPFVEAVVEIVAPQVRSLVPKDTDPKGETQQTRSSPKGMELKMRVPAASKSATAHQP